MPKTDCENREFINACNCRDSANPCKQKPCYMKPCVCPPGPQGAAGATGPTGPQGATGSTGPTGPFLSSYIEALGETQIIEDAENIVFSIADNVGNNFEFISPGTDFIVHRTGLYLVEWSVNLALDNTVSAEIGLLQNGAPTSGAANTAETGNFSSGALINITAVPFTISLHNQSGDSIIIEDDVSANGAASIRILRFADGPAA